MTDQVQAPSNADVAAQVLSRRAVQFGEQARAQNQSAYPFFQNFIPFPYTHSQVNAATGQYSVTSAQAEGPDGLSIAAGGLLDIPIVMDKDCVFHLLYVKYGAWNPSPSVPNVGSREVLLSPQTSLQGHSMFDATMNQREPYWIYLDVSFYFTSSGGRDLYGGFQADPFTGAKAEQPIPVWSLQGNQDGLGMVRTAYQLPKGSTVRIHVVNRYTAALRVYGHLFGYKVTV